MFTRKRLCPYQHEDSPISDQFSHGQLKKKPCLEYPHQLSWNDNMVNCVKEREMMAEDSMMECDEPANLHTPGHNAAKATERLTGNLQTVEQIQHTDLCHMTMPNNNNNSLNNNNNNGDMYITPSEVCPRCQAGESGHFGHIGR